MDDPLNTAGKGPIFFPRNADVKTLNNQKLFNLPGQPLSFCAVDAGPRREMLSSVLLPALAEFKVGAKVICVANLPRQGLCNGSFGVVTALDPSQIIVDFTSVGQRIVKPFTHRIELDGQVVASRTQMPLILAWALSIHKSQSMELDEAVMDLSACFADGQTYCALSRVRTLEVVHLLGFSRRSIKASALAMAYEQRVLTELKTQVTNPLSCLSHGCFRVCVRLKWTGRRTMICAAGPVLTWTRPGWRRPMLTWSSSFLSVKIRRTRKPLRMQRRD